MSKYCDNPDDCGYTDCPTAFCDREFEEDVCDVCGTLFKPTHSVIMCPECAAKRAEQGEAL